MERPDRLAGVQERRSGVARQNGATLGDPVPLLMLQRLAGNRAVSSLLSAGEVISAGQMASGLQRACCNGCASGARCEEETGLQHAVQRQLLPPVPIVVGDPPFSDACPKRSRSQR